MYKLSSKAKASSDVVLTELDEEAVLLNLKTKQYFSLNNTGLWIWNKLDEGHSIADVTEQMLDAYDVSPEQAKQSVLDLVEQLDKEKLIDVIHEK